VLDGNVFERIFVKFLRGGNNMHVNQVGKENEQEKWKQAVAHSAPQIWRDDIWNRPTQNARRKEGDVRIESEEPVWYFFTFPQKQEMIELINFFV